MLNRFRFRFTLCLVSARVKRNLVSIQQSDTSFSQFIWLFFLFTPISSSFPCCPMLHLSSSSHNSAKLVLSNRFLHTKTGLCGWNIALCHRLLWNGTGALVMEGSEEKLWLCSLSCFGLGELNKKAKLGLFKN